jgi:phage gp29-like protein
MATLLQKIGRALRLVENQPIEDASAPKKVTIHVEESGTSGTQNYAGYYSEEYLHSLRGTQAADLWDKMRRSDPKIKMVLSAVKNPIKGAQWTVQPGKEGDAKAQDHAELIEQILFRDLEQSWTQQLAEILTHLDFGFAAFEVIHKIVENHEKFGSYNSIKKIAWRSPRTIMRWNLDPKTGQIISISQWAFGDLRKTVDIPGEFLLIFTHEKEGDNYEGISALRPCYGPWSRKDKYLKLMAVGIEKHAIPIPYMEVPAGAENTPEYANAKKILERYVSHQQQFITYPAGWKLEFAHASTFDASKIREAIDKENTEIAHAFLENFLELGQSGSGSYALSYDLSDFFLLGIQHVANNICETFNRHLIPELIKLNFGPQESYPELKVSGIKDKPGKDLAAVMKSLVDAKILTPDNDLEVFFRKKYELPKKAEVDPAAKPPALPPPADPTTTPDGSANPKTPPTDTQQPSPAEAKAPKLSEKVLKFVEKPRTPRALIGVKSEELRGSMSGMLKEIGQGVISDLMAKKKKAPASQHLNLTSQVEPKGSRDYKAELSSFLSATAADAIEQARKEIPGSAKVKLTERLQSRKLRESPYDLLPAAIQRTIDAQVGLLTTFQIQDLLKAIYFQFNSSVTSTDSDTQLEADLAETMDRFLEGSSVAAGAGNTVSKLVNESRSVFFFEDDVATQIESFTFVNGDPVSPICQDLAGTVFAKDDPNMERYSPPLHHNCKSYLVANLVGADKPLDPNGLKPSKASLEQYITLSDGFQQSFGIVYIDVSKKAALSYEDAKRLAGEIVDLSPEQPVTVSESSYRVELKNSSLFEPGTLKSFEPIEGVTVYYGKLRALT